MRQYCVQLYNLQDIKIAEGVIEAESALIAVLYSLVPEVSDQIPELKDVETFEEAVKILEDKGLKVEVFRV